MQNIQVIKTKIPIDYEKIAKFCQRWKIAELALFGSVLRDDFRPDSSDIDVLVCFADDARWTLFDMVDIEEKRRGDLLRFLQASQTMGETSWVREFRRWIRQKLGE